MSIGRPGYEYPSTPGEGYVFVEPGVTPFSPAAEFFDLYARKWVTTLQRNEYVRGYLYRIKAPDVSTENKELALDVSLDTARALHRVWRALNDGDCPKCHYPNAATDIERRWHSETGGLTHGLRCPNCQFTVHHSEIIAIEKLFAPAMDAAVEIFEKWRADRAKSTES